MSKNNVFVKILPPTYLLITLMVMLAVHFLIPMVTLFPFPWNLLGLLPLILGIVINILADREFHKTDTTVKPFEESSALITNGVYQFSRHPMYLGMALVLVGVAMLLGSLTPFVFIPFFVLLFNEIFIKVEEQMMKRQFGDAWNKYAKKVRRWM